MAAFALMPAVTMLAQQTPPAPAAPSAPSQAAGKKHHVSRRSRDAAQKLFLEGAADLERKDIRAAMAAFARAAQLDPEDRKYAISEEIARQHLVTALIQQADKEKIMGHLAASHASLEEAYRVDPRSPMVAQHMDELASATVAGEPALRSDTDTLAAPIQLQPKPVRRSFHLHTSERSLITQVMSAYGIQPTLDDSVGTRMVRYDLDDASFPAAERALNLATNTFCVPLDPTRALVAKDDRSNRDKYERIATETVYLPGMSNEEITEMVNLAKNVFFAKTASAEPSQNSMTVRGMPGDLDALNGTLANLLDGRSELQLNVRMYTVDRTKATNLGVIIPTQTTLFNVYSEASSLLQSNSALVQQIISSGLAAPGDWPAILAILVGSGQVSNTILSQPFGIFGGGLTATGITYSGGTLNMQLNSSDVHSIDQLELRVLDNEQATIRSGERYPIETSNYSSLSAAPLSIPGISNPGLSNTLSNLGVSLSALESAATQTIPQVEYQDIGLTLEVTPRFQGRHSVSLKMHLTLSALAGSSINGLPVLADREYSGITSVVVGQSAVLMGALSRQESDSITGIPGLSDLPGFQDATNKSTNFDYSELVIVVTPHIVRAVRQQAAEKMILLPGGNRSR